MSFTLHVHRITVNLSLCLHTMFTILLFIFGFLRTITGGPVGGTTAIPDITEVTNIYVSDVVTYDDATNSFRDENTSCDGEKDPGFGRYIYSKWYFDVNEKICKPFNYLGSGGNNNRFSSFDTCSSKCNSCCYQSIPAQNSSCDGGGFEWAYEQGRAECLPFKNSTCDSDSINRFPTKRECERDCRFYGVDTPRPPHVCRRINTHNSVCNSTFILSGKVSSISVEIYTKYLVNRLVVEVLQTYKGRNLLPIYNVTHADGSTTEFLHIKKILVEGRQCYNIQTAVTYVFMGYNQYNNILIDNASFVQEERSSTLSKINTFLPTCSP